MGAGSGLRGPHPLLEGRKPNSGIEGKAREARYALLGEWCAAHDVPSLFVAHTLEDQAETFLLRLGRGSGVDGLSAMRPRAPFPVAGFDSVQVLRPLLEIGRAELRAFLTARGTPWLEDPMNEDSRFARVRLRKALPTLEAAGVSARRIAEAARHLAARAKRWRQRRRPFSPSTRARKAVISHYSTRRRWHESIARPGSGHSRRC